MAGQTIWINDFRDAVREAAHAASETTSPTSTAGTVSYRLGSRPGYMLKWTGSESCVVRVASPVAGWHAIHIGFMGASGLRMRLSSERWFHMLESTVRWNRATGDGEEAFWKIADLTGIAFEFLPMPSERPWDRRGSQILDFGHSRAAEN